MIAPRLVLTLDCRIDQFAQSLVGSGMEKLALLAYKMRRDRRLDRSLEKGIEHVIEGALSPARWRLCFGENRKLPPLLATLYVPLVLEDLQQGARRSDTQVDPGRHARIAGTGASRGRRSHP